MKKLWGGLKDLFYLARFSLMFLKGWLKLLVRGRFGSAIVLPSKLLKDLNGAFSRFIDTDPLNVFQTRKLSPYSSVQLARLQKSCLGLHSLFPSTGPSYSYSILVPVYKPKPEFLRTALSSALDQTASALEVLVGFDGNQPQEVYDVVDHLIRSHPRGKACLRAFRIDRSEGGGGISATTNYLAKMARHSYLLLMDHDDWIRCDLLYRYEQVLRLARNPHLVLYCNEYKIDENDFFLAGTEFIKPEKPVFPYVFINFICHCLLVPKGIWDQVGGLRKEFDGAQDYDLCLRLDLAGAEFQNVPLLLYAWRSHSQSTAQSTGNKSYASDAGIRALQEYCNKKQIKWRIAEGLFSTSYKVEISVPDQLQAVHVVIPYKDQKELTLQSVKSVLQQKGVRPLITAIDNNSQDLEIHEDLKKLGVEVIRVEEPFNFSRINNLAAFRSKFREQTQSILFLNNDVVLNEDALFQMLFWVQQPRIGAVGARLHYPDNKIQHGGIELIDGLTSKMNFFHTDWHRSFSQAGFSRVTRITEGVTAACILVRRDLFEGVGGFDEIWYPIAYSDTDLCRKFRQKGYFSLYNPFAFGFHYESHSRGYNSIEDLENSRWLFVHTRQRFEGVELAYNTVFEKY